MRGEVGSERVRGVDRVGAGLGAMDGCECGLGVTVGPLGQRGQDVGGLVDLMPTLA
jgi:hypothetical protein